MSPSGPPGPGTVASAAKYLGNISDVKGTTNTNTQRRIKGRQEGGMEKRSSWPARTLIGKIRGVSISMRSLIQDSLVWKRRIQVSVT